MIFKDVSQFSARKPEIGDESAASQSVAAVIMMVFQYSNNPGTPYIYVCHRKKYNINTSI